ncbi:MAG: NifU family protein [Gemmataceae bacterium]|jgi:Fe-S cluster biogenesis protein NfuA
MSDSAILARIAAELREHVAPALGLDPAAVEAVAVENGIATVRLTEACASCPASLPLLVAELEAELKARVPEVEIVEAVG